MIQVKRPYTKIKGFIEDFYESVDSIREVDTSQWTSDKVASDNIRRTIRQMGFNDICVVKRGDRIFLMKK